MEAHFIAYGAAARTGRGGGEVGQGEWERMIDAARGRGAPPRKQPLAAFRALAPYALAACIGGMIGAGAVMTAVRHLGKQSYAQIAASPVSAPAPRPAGSLPAIPADKRVYVKISKHGGFLASAGAQVRLHALTDTSAIILLRSGILELARTGADRDIEVVTPHGAAALDTGAMRIIVNEMSSEFDLYEGRARACRIEAREAAVSLEAGRRLVATPGRLYQSRLGDPESLRWQASVIRRHIQWLHDQSARRTAARDNDNRS
jgi:hypothetical protein